MLLGPVFRAELLRNARHRRHYMMRFVYGLLLLLLVWAGYQSAFQADSVATLGQVAIFAGDTFFTFAFLQIVTILILIPALFGGAIADEKQRKTLHYLMASQLSSGEIVIDKLLGRATLLGVCLAIGLPIVSILGLFGGVPLAYVIIAYVGTISTAMFAAALSILVSTFARRVRQAVLAAYMLLLAWLFIPTILTLLMSTFPFPTEFYSWIKPINDVLKDSSPLGAAVDAGLGRLRLGGAGTLWHRFAWMVVHQLGWAAVMLLLAVWRLRPTFRRQEEVRPRRAWFPFREGAQRRRWHARPACGDDAILWKERYFAHNDLLTRLVLLPMIIVVTIPLALTTAVEFPSVPALVDFWRSGSSPPASKEFAWFLHVNLGWYLAFWLVAVAGASASSVTIEREEDTWISLISTPLTGARIVRAKVLGAIWNQRGFGAMMILIWLLGLVTGAFHPLGVAASVLVVGVLTWFAATVGIFASLRARNTSRALATAIGTLYVFNGYPILLVYWLTVRTEWESSFMLLGYLPRLATGPLVSYEFVRQTSILGPGPWVSSAILGGLVLLVIVGVSFLLNVQAVSRFDRWLDRPRLSETEKRLNHGGRGRTRKKDEEVEPQISQMYAD